MGKGFYSQNKKLVGLGMLNSAQVLVAVWKGGYIGYNTWE